MADGEPFNTVLLKEQPEEAEMITGDENIVNLKFTVQYRIQDPLPYLFRMSEPERLVQNLTESVIRQIVGQTEIDAVYSHGRSAIEAVTKALLQADLDRYQAGISILAVSIIYDHAPDDVHAAFRDVASSEEDKNTRISVAHGFQNTTLSRARGQAAQLLAEAKAYQEEKINRAQGEASGFREKVAAYEKTEEITELRLYLETIETTLPKVNKFIKPPKGTIGRMDLWFMDSTKQIRLPEFLRRSP
jgi:HflK protein